MMQASLFLLLLLFFFSLNSIEKRTFFVFVQFRYRHALIHCILSLSLYRALFVGFGNICSYLECTRCACGSRKEKRQRQRRWRRWHSGNLCSAKCVQQLPLPWIERVHNIAFLRRLHFERCVRSFLWNSIFVDGEEGLLQCLPNVCCSSGKIIRGKTFPCAFVHFIRSFADGINASACIWSLHLLYTSCSLTAKTRELKMREAKWKKNPIIRYLLVRKTLFQSHFAVFFLFPFHFPQRCILPHSATAAALYTFSTQRQQQQKVCREQKKTFSSLQFLPYIVFVLGV